jgi:ABC-type transport system substrate-binding protein
MRSSSRLSCITNHLHVRRYYAQWIIFSALAFSLIACSDQPWNNPYPEHWSTTQTLYSSFSESPKHLDPARAYSANEYGFIAQIYEPPLQYHFLKRPYQLIPLTATALPSLHYFDQAGQPVPAHTPADQIAMTEYRITIQSGIRYQPHPAFAQSAEGRWLYHELTTAALDDIKTLADFNVTGTRELTAADYVYQIKRLAAPWVHSPIAGIMADHLVDFKALQKRLVDAYDQASGPLIDLDAIPFTGAEVIDRYQYCIRVHGRYPQFQFWLAMPFFAPMPWEAEAFYRQPGMSERNLTLDWYPIGTGPFLLEENNPNLRMILARNPLFHGETYPTTGMPEDQEQGLLADAGRALPLIDRALYSLEKENIPYWNKFLQGYYDRSGLSSEAFDQAIEFGTTGEAQLTTAMQAKGIQLDTAITTSIWYLGFNMVDPIIGGDSERARLLRQAIAIAVDFEEYISIFANGRGAVAQSPIPPGIFGYRDGQAGINPYLFTWHQGQPQRRTIHEARQLLTQAGYHEGRDPATGQPLTLYYEAMDAGPDGKARLNWMRKQFDKLGIELVIRATDYNRFQDKMREGQAQIFMWGWNADYPDPENFLFLFYGANAKIQGGENAANYHNDAFDALFIAMKNRDDGPVRQAMIDAMITLLQYDAPWSFGFFPKAYSLHHRWLYNNKPHLMANNTLKYQRLDPVNREQSRSQWNQPVLWPLGVIFVIICAALVPAIRLIRQREQSTGRC